MEFSSKIRHKPDGQYLSMNFCLVSKIGCTNSNDDFYKMNISLLDCMLHSAQTWLPSCIEIQVNFSVVWLALAVRYVGLLLRVQYSRGERSMQMVS